MTAIVGALCLGFGLGGGLAAWLLGNRPDLDDCAETLERSRAALDDARRELMLNETYTQALLDDPAYYVSQRCGPPAKGGA